MRSRVDVEPRPSAEWSETKGESTVILPVFCLKSKKTYLWSPVSFGGPDPMNWKTDSAELKSFPWMFTANQCLNSLRTGFCLDGASGSVKVKWKLNQNQFMIFEKLTSHQQSVEISCFSFPFNFWLIFDLRGRQNISQININAWRVRNFQKLQFRQFFENVWNDFFIAKLLLNINRGRLINHTENCCECNKNVFRHCWFVFIVKREKSFMPTSTKFNSWMKWCKIFSLVCFIY